MEDTLISPVKQATTLFADGWNPAETRMSFFEKPITNKRPAPKAVSLFDVYQMVRTRRYAPETEQLRTMTDHAEARAYKGRHFDYVTPSGTFSYCSDASLTKHSGVLCIDLDGLEERLEEMRGRLLSDSQIVTLLLFRSPSGNGLKWFVHIDLSICDHGTWFRAIRNYLMATYQLTEKQVDKSCSNVSKACFLCYDPDAYLLTELIEFF